MARLAPTKDTIRNLFARSGNVCAFPGCTAELINRKDKFVAQICHIEAAEEGGERFNPAMTDELRRHSDNLILLCYPHHIETNDVDQYTAEVLRQIKLDHEKVNGQKTYKINEQALYQVFHESEKYWKVIEEHLAIRDLEREYPLNLNSKDGFHEVLEKTKDLIQTCEVYLDRWVESDDRLQTDFIDVCDKLGFESKKVEELPYYQNPFINRNWEVQNIGFHNLKVDLKLALCQLEIKYLEEYIKLNSEDKQASSRLEGLRESLKQLIATQGYTD